MFVQYVNIFTHGLYYLEETLKMMKQHVNMHYMTKRSVFNFPFFCAVGSITASVTNYQLQKSIMPQPKFRQINQFIYSHYNL